ncbi:tyrosine-type recombinase/integrase [Rugamonas sp. A1-17]|nr:tyrosine-type recombinase/integrase [Rugamonas sp. A1-17]
MGRAGTGLSVGSVNTVLEDCATLAQLDYVPDLSSHSLRRGMATSAHRAGADFRDIKKQGGWRHDGTVQGYIEEASRFEEMHASSDAAGEALPRRACRNRGLLRRLHCGAGGMRIAIRSPGANALFLHFIVVPRPPTFWH